jgi:hypothetical protein
VTDLFACRPLPVMAVWAGTVPSLAQPTGAGIRQEQEGVNLLAAPRRAGLRSAPSWSGSGELGVAIPFLLRPSDGSYGMNLTSIFLRTIESSCCA